MGYRFKVWGEDGSLASFRDFYVFQGNGVAESTAAVSSEIVGDRADVIQEDGAHALRIRRYASDPTVSGFRTELTANEYSQILDWSGEDVEGAVDDNARRQYRMKFKVPEQSLALLSGAGAPFLIVAQLHQVPDTSPADTAGLSPTLSIQLRFDAYGRLRMAIVRNLDTTPTVTTPDPSLQAAEWVSWPYRLGTWEDIHVDVAWSYSSLGHMTIYRNRRPVLVEAGAANCPNNSPARGGGGMYPKIGCYMAPPADFRVYHRGLIVGDHAATFADMYPELAGAVPLERVSGPLSCLGD